MRYRTALLLLTTGALHVGAQSLEDLFTPESPDADVFTLASTAVSLALSGGIGGDTCSFLRGSASERSLALVGTCFNVTGSNAMIRDRLNAHLPELLQHADETALWNPERLEISRDGQATTFIQVRPGEGPGTTRVIVASRRMYESALRPSPVTSPALQKYLPPEEQTFGHLTAGARYLPSDASGSWGNAFQALREGARLTLKRGGKTVVLNLDSTRGTVNGGPVTLNARPFISQRFTYLPEDALRLLGCSVPQEGTLAVVRCGDQNLEDKLVTFR